MTSTPNSMSACLWLYIFKGDFELLSVRVKRVSFHENWLASSPLSPGDLGGTFSLTAHSVKPLGLFLASRRQP